MGIIKLVTNGDSTVQFRALSLGHAVTIGFGLLSIIIAQQTWLWAGAHERALIIESVRVQITNDISMHAIVDRQRFDQIERRLEAMDQALDRTMQQVNMNTGKLGSMK